MLKKIETLTEQTSIHSAQSEKLSEKNYLHYNLHTNINKVEMFHVLHNKVAVLMRRRSEQGTKVSKSSQKKKGWTINISA